MTKNNIISLLLCIFGGCFGLHYFYNKKIGMGVLYLFTAGLFGIGWVIDIIRLSIQLLSSKSLTIENNINNTKKQVVINPYINEVPHYIYNDAYIIRKQNQLVKDYVIFDTETTGLEPSIDKIIEISAIKFVNNKRVEAFSMLINPKTKLDPFITKLTGITQNDLIGKPTIEQALPHFYDFIENYTLIAHNAPYDIKMLACEAYRSSIPLCSNKIIDTIPIAKKLIPKGKIENYKLETIKNYLGLNYNSHRALDDCESCAKIYQLYLSSLENKKIIIVDNDTGEILEQVN